MLSNLAQRLREAPLTGDIGIPHTRWATHGTPTEDNAHPHIVGDVVLVHNGIIENFKPLRDELLAGGRTFKSQTDSEVVAHLLSREIERGAEPRDALAAVLPRLHGAFALGVLVRTNASPCYRGWSRRPASRIWSEATIDDSGSR